MAKFKKSILFRYNERDYFLFRALNYGTNSNELKFSFIEKKIPRGVISTEERNKIDDKDIVTDYSEVTYHSDGSVLKKFPTYPIPSMKYKNPKETGFRRRPLNKIDDWEPLFMYQVFNYRVNEIPEDHFSTEDDTYTFENELVFNGNSFHVLINLAHVNFSEPDSTSPYEINQRIKNITNQLDIWIVIVPINKKGNYIKIKGMDQPIFSTNNQLQIVEKNA